MLCALFARPAAVAGQVDGWRFGLLRSGAVAAGGPLSAVETTRYGSLELEAAAPLVERATWRLEMPLGLIALAWVRETALGDASVAPTGDHWVVPPEAGRTTSRGFGVRAPGIRLVVGAGKVRVQADAAVGIVRFGIPTPAANATRTNYTAEIGAGLQAHLAGAHVGFGYRLHHLSNAGRDGRVNPGIDSHMLYIGLWIH